MVLSSALNVALPKCHNYLVKQHYAPHSTIEILPPAQAVGLDSGANVEDRRSLGLTSFVLCLNPYQLAIV